MAVFSFTRAFSYVEHRVSSIKPNLIVYYTLVSFTVRIGYRVSTLLGKNRCEYVILDNFLLLLCGLPLCCYDFIPIMLGRKLEIVKISISLLLNETEYFNRRLIIISRFDKSCSCINDTSMIGAIIVATSFIK